MNTSFDFKKGEAEKTGVSMKNTQKNEAELKANNEDTKEIGIQLAKLTSTFNQMRPAILATAFKAGTPISEVAFEGPGTTLGSSNSGAS